MHTPSHWIVTAHGADHPISGPAVLLPGTAPHIEVIAHALAQINRFTGHAARPYSVAEHSLLVCDIVAANGHNHHGQRAALLHDAHEAITGDMASPVKWTLGTEWIGFEAVHARMVRQAYHFQTAYTAHRQAIKRADLTALATERRDLLRFDPATNLPWPILDTPGQEVPPLEAVDLNNPARAAMSWRHHRDAFLDRYRVLTAQCSTSSTTPTTTPTTTTEATPS